MTRTSSIPQTLREERLAAALQAYQAALDLGLPVDRVAFAANYPDLVGLVNDLRVLDDLHRAGAELNDGPPSLMAIEPTLADFDLLHEAGRGGMGVVYEARQSSLNRRVAVKVLTRATALDDRTRRRFLHEARAAALVEHPHVVPVFHVGEENGVPFYVMPFIDGPSLATALKTHNEKTGPVRLPAAGTAERFAFVARVGVQAASALAAAHAQGVIHRDIKPANLLLDPNGKVWVADFGLALAPFAEGLTQTGGRAGTPRYMSPEQLIGRREGLDVRTDVYSLGVTLYELATGRPVYATSDERELIQAVMAAHPTRPRDIVPSIPFDLETIILKAMARDPADRYQTAQLLADDLTRFLDGRPVLARRPGPILKCRRWLRRHQRPALAVGLTLLVGVLVGLSASTVVVWRAYQSEREAHEVAETNRQLALAAVIELGHGSDEILAHAPHMLERQLVYLQKCQERVAPFADDLSLPETVRWDIVWLNHGLAQVHYRLGQFAKAEAYSRALIRGITPLVRSEPENAMLPRGLAEAYQRLGQCLAARGDHAAARSVYREGLVHAETAYRMHPARAPIIVTRHELLCELADRDEILANTPGSSLSTYLTALEAFEGLRERYPTGHPLSYMRLATNWSEAAIRYERLGNLDAAERLLMKAVGNDEHLVRHFVKEPPDIREHTLHPRGLLGLLRIRRGRIEEGLPDLRRSATDFVRYTEMYPTVVSYKTRLLTLSAGLAHAESLAGHPTEAQTAASRCVPLLADPAVPLATDVKARIWALLPAELRDPAMGEQFLAAGAGVSAGVRSVVLFRLGQFEDAERTAATDGSPLAGLVRAAGLARLGRDEEAARLYDEVVDGYAIAPLREPDIVSFQREAAAILAEARTR